VKRKFLLTSFIHPSAVSIHSYFFLARQGFLCPRSIRFHLVLITTSFTFGAGAGFSSEAREIVEDLTAIALDEALKVAVFDFDDVENGSSQALTAAVPHVQTVVSGLHWTDMMSAQVSKGRALSALQARLGVLPEQTAVFGDYLNDLDLYDHADLGFAMRNAHPGIHAAAAYTAPANTEDGVLRTVEELLRRSRRQG